MGLIVFTFINPFSWNDASERTVVQQANGAQFEMDTRIGVANALSKVTLPAYYAPGGGASTNNMLDALLSTKLLDK